MKDSNLREKLNEVKKLYHEGQVDTALEKVYSISWDYRRNEVIRDKRYQFFEFITLVLNTVPTGKARTHALNSVMSFAIESDNSTRLCSAELKLISTLMNLLKTTKGDDQLQVSKCLGNIGIIRFKIYKLFYK